MDKILGAALAIIKGLAVGLLNALPLLVGALPRIIISIINFIMDNLPQIIEIGIEILVALIDGLIEAIPQLVASLPQIITAIDIGLGKAVALMVEIGKNIVQGLWQGIAAMGAWIKEKVTGFFGGIIDGAKGLLGIHSPSTVFAGIGGHMAEGLGIGFEKEMNKVSRQIQNSIPAQVETDVNTTVTANLVNGLVGGLSSVLGGGAGNRPITLQVLLDSKIIAQTIFDPLKDVSRQRGVAIG